MKKLFFLICPIVALLSSCSGFLESDVSKTQKKNEQEILDYISRTNLNAKASTSGSGVYFVVTQANTTGRQVLAGDEVTFQYKLSLLDGTLIDSTASSKPISLIWGANINIISGFLEAIFLLKEGESGVFLIPSSQAFGNSANGKIPANAVLRLDLKIDKLRTEDQQIDDYIANKKLTLTEKTSTGLRFISITKVASGSELKAPNVVTVKYTGTLLNDKQFDTGTFDVTIGSGGVIAGFSEAVQKLKLGEKGRFILPSKIAYGTNGSGTIPPYTPLVFDIEIMAVK
ncbi:MAG: FKBP-type peptidyl-prolyl cis-trans isomerase [Spirosomaceae bacterium]|jgi:FKBP-type peptidyl-prolyl cis-trans isomerase|nr:FKBP-type peptidyl-prolyl cis-trans isomerase [Spirosomataceae bacterium]